MQPAIRAAWRQFVLHGVAFVQNGPFAGPGQVLRVGAALSNTPPSSLTHRNDKTGDTA
jgi:hypothetical protein